MNPGRTPLAMKVRHVCAYVAALFLASLVMQFVDDRTSSFAQHGPAVLVALLAKVALFIVLTAWLYSRLAPTPRPAWPRSTRDDITVH